MIFMFNNFMRNKRGIPEFGFIVDGKPSYRATAIGIMEMDGLTEIEHRNGETYTLEQLEEARIKPRK